MSKNSQQNSSNSVHGSHPLEGDGNLLNLFHYLWKKNKDLESCPNIRIPDTIVYEHNFPRGWYCYDPKHKEIKKKTGKELDAKKILSEFLKNEYTGNQDVVAYYLSKCDDDKTSVEFFDKDDLEKFLCKRERRDEGILQKFLFPKGAYNSVVQAIWSPHIVLIERRNNRHKLTDYKYSLYERSVTYEGPAHYSQEVFCAPQLKEKIKIICESIVNHFFSTEHERITRMVLYFKVDSKSNIWLLWGSSLRIADKVSVSPVPLNLSPAFVSPIESVKKKSYKKKKKKPETESKFECPNCSKIFLGTKYELPLERVVKYFKRKKKFLKQTDPMDQIFNNMKNHFQKSKDDYYFSLPSQYNNTYKDIFHEYKIDENRYCVKYESLKKIEELRNAVTHDDQDEKRDKVPQVLLKFLPDLTNASYKFLCLEPLFLSRSIELCEQCFLKFTDGRPSSSNSFKRRVKRKGIRKTNKNKS